MKTLYRIILISVIILAFSSDQGICRDLAKVKLDQSQFKLQMQEALDVNDSTLISKLISENRYHVGGFIGGLLKSYLKSDLSSNAKVAEKSLANANYIAGFYKKIFASKIYLDYINLYKNWSREEKVLQIKGDSLNQAGINYAQKNKLPEAMDKWREALKIFKHNENKFSQVVPLKNIALAHRYLGRFHESKDTLQLALGLVRETENKPSEAGILRELGVISHVSGEPHKAVNYWKQAAAIFEKINNVGELGITMSMFGIYYRNLGKPEQALTYYERALKLDRKAQNEREEGNVLNNIGNIYMDYYADYEKAIGYFKQALAIKRKYNETYTTSTIMGNIALCYKDRGNYAKGLEYLFDALKISKKIKSRAAMAKNLSDIGASYADIGMYSESIPYIKQAIDTLRNIGEKKDEIEAMINLGVCYKKLKEYNKAYDYYHKTLVLVKKSELRGEEAYIKGNMADIEVEYKNYRQALELYNQSIKISRQIKDKRQEGIIQTRIGEIFLQQQEYAKALERYREGLKIAMDIKSPEGIWQAQYGIGNVLDSLNQKEKAVEAYTQAIEIIESMRAKLKVKSFKEAFMVEKISVYEAIITLLLKLGRNEDAYEYLERSKARSSLDILSIGRIDIASGITPERLDRKKRLERKLDKIHKELLDEYSKIESEQDATLIASLEDSLENARFQHTELLQEIELNHPKYASLIGITGPLKLKQVQEKVIPPGTALIEYMVGKDHTIVWVIRKNSFVYEKLSLKREYLEMLVNGLLQPFRDVKEGKVRNFADIDFDLQLARKLYEQIFRPLEVYLEKDDHLIIVPDGILYYLPFEALVTEIEKKKHDQKVVFSRYENAHYLVEKYAISYSPSASVLDPALLTTEKATQQEGKLLAFGNPDFGMATIAAQKTNEEQGFNFFALLTRSSRGWIFSNLPKAEEEVKTIAKILKPSLFYINGNAKEEYFKKEAGLFSIIHLATHCIVEETQPMYSRIVFAQDDNPAEDGFLYTYEVFNLRLNADLVTLSACETGLGKLNRGEGLVGLTRAFMYAGAHSLLVSLWSVDESTSELMKYFYQNLKKGQSKSKGDALRNAKLKLLKTRRNGISFAHPYLWAPFILVGQNQQIDLN